MPATRRLWFYFFLLFLPLSSLSGFGNEKVLYEGDSLYHHIRVSEEDGYRYLSFNRARGSQSAVNVNNPDELKFAYTKAAFVVPAFLPQPPQKILIVGLGGGSIPRVMAKSYPDSKIDVVDIDGDVVRAAKDFFFFAPSPNTNVIIKDGRRFLRESREKYDLIFLDAYDDHSIPFHLTTREFFELVKKRLSPDGLVASNVWGPRSDRFYLSEIKTMQQIFPHIYLIDAVSSNNYIIIAESFSQPTTIDLLKDRIPSFQRKYSFDFQLSTFSDTFEDLSSSSFKADVLSDDFAPVEILRTQKVPSK